MYVYICINFIYIYIYVYIIYMLQDEKTGKSKARVCNLSTIFIKKTVKYLINNCFFNLETKHSDKLSGFL